MDKNTQKIAQKYAFKKKPVKNFGLLLKNYKLSDDIAFRFSDRTWSEWPLTADKFTHWLTSAEGQTINLFMDYETFGEHQWSETGIFEFLRHLPEFCLQNQIGFQTPTETLREHQAVGVYDVPALLSWADLERDLSAWYSNKLQSSALQRVFELEPQIKALAQKTHPQKDALMQTWRKLQTSDHFYYMCIKYWNDGDVHAYFSPYESPYDAFINYMNILSDFEIKLNVMK